MKVEILYFDGCPSWQEGLANIEAALLKEKLPGKVDLVLVKDISRLKALDF